MPGDPPRQTDAQGLPVLRTGESWAHLSLDAAQLGIWTHDIAQNSIRFDARAAAHYGFAETEVTLDAVLARVHSEDATILAQNIAEALDSASDGRYHTQYRVIHPDGAIHWLAIEARVYFDGEGAERRPVWGFGTSQEITAHKQAEQQRDAFTRLYATLSQVNQSIVRSSDQQQLFDTICKVAIEYGAFRLAWLGLRDWATGAVVIVAAAMQAGVDPPPASAWIEGIPGQDPLVDGALRAGEVTISHDVQLDPALRDWHAAAQRGNLHAAAAIPIRRQGVIVGCLSLYAADSGFFAVEAERQLLVEIGLDISFALDAFQAEAERRAAEEALRASESMLKKSQSLAHVGHWIWEPRTNHLYWSEEMHRIFGVAPEGFDGDLATVIAQAIHPDDVAMVERANQAVVEEQRPAPLEYRVVWPDRSVHTVWAQPGEVVLDAEGNVAWLTGIVQDITERKQAEVALREAHDRLEARVRERTAEVQDLYDNAPCGYHSLNADGLFVRINQTELAWLGYHRDEIVGVMGFRDVITPASQQIFDYNFPLFKARGWAKDLEFEMVRKDGSVFPVLLSATVLFDPTGQYLLSRSTIFDITERKRTEEALRRSEAELRRSRDELQAANVALARAARLKDEFLASMSHELRTPLTGILGLSESLQAEVYGTLNARQARTLQSIEESGRHLLNLINDILDLSKIEAGKLELEMTTFSVNELCQSSLRLVKQMAAAKGHAIAYELDPADFVMYADPRRIKQALVNLLSNAVKFTPDGGRIGLEVHADRGQQTVTFAVWDNGIGIAPEDTARLFQPFTQLDSSLARTHSGTGLGLSLVQRLADLHGGSIALESAPGQGSRFTLALPWIAAAPAYLERPIAASTTQAALGSALVVDDSPTTVDLLAGYLRELGIQEIIVHGRAEGVVERAQAAQPAVILMDILLPDGSGWEVLRQLKANPMTQAIPVIVVSVIDDRMQALQLGAVDHLLKPLSRSDLQLALDQARRAPVAPRAGPVLVVAHQPARHTLLLAEDHAINRQLICDYLGVYGYTVLTAVDGVEAVRMVQEQRPALVLMDIQMPAMDGLEAIRTIRAQEDPVLAAVPIVALTALAMPGDRERCLAAGADEYISKPVDLKALLGLLAEMLE